MKTRILIAIVFAIAVCSFGYAQYLPRPSPGSNYSNKSDPLEYGKPLSDSIDYNYEVSIIHPSEECNIEIDGGLKLAKVQIVDVEDSLFTVMKTGIDRDFQISGLSKISFIKHGFWKGFLWGTLGTLAATGVVFAILAGNAHGEDALGVLYLLAGGVLIAAPVGAVIGMISEFAVRDDVYSFGNVSKETKLKRLRYILSQHKE